MGEIPSRQVFSSPEYKKSLAPYYQVVSTVKQGDMEHFKKLLVQHALTFKRDSTTTLINRLKHTVLKFGLKKINVSYSKISISDIRSKLHIDGTDEEAEQIVAKAIRDGVIDAVIDHEGKFVRSQEVTDVY